MFPKKIIINCKVLIFAVLVGVVSVYTEQTSVHSAPPDEAFSSSRQDVMQSRQFDLGRRLGKSLSRDPTIFIGTIKTVKPRVVDVLSPMNAGERVIADVTVSIDELLSGNNSSREPEIQLEQVKRPNSNGFRSDEGWLPWDGVDVQVNRRLLVVYDNAGNDPAHATAPQLLVSDENLFQSIRDAVILRTMLAKNPEEILQAPALLSKREDFILSGYVISYLSLGIRPNSVDSEALVLSKLLGSNQMPKAAWLPIRLTLTQLISSELYPVTEETRTSVTRELITIGNANDVELAKQAVIILVKLSDRKKLNMRAFLSDEQRKVLNRIYLSAFPNHPAHPNFESQLRPAATFK